MALAPSRSENDSPGALFSPTTERRLLTFVPPLLVALLTLPFVLRQNAWWEWATPYWLLERQAAHVAAHGVPTLFLHVSSGAFNPFYAFYGGFTFSVLAYPAALLGAWPVFVAATVAAVMAGYLGIWWTARNLGLSHRLAVLPALAFTTTPYLLSDLYGRGAWAEFVAVNAAAVMLGGITALVWQRPRGRARAVAALVASGATVAGTHDLTLLMSAIILPLIVLAILPLAPRRAGIGAVARELVRSAGAIGLGVGLTGAWLIPSVWLGPSTWVARASINDGLLRQTDGLDRVANVLSPWPTVPTQLSERWIYAQAPVPAMVWALAAIVLVAWVRRRGPDRTIAASAALVVLAMGLVLLIVDPHWWLSFPRLVKAVQFPFRLIPYLATVVALGIVIGLRAIVRRRPRRWAVGALVVVVGAQLGTATWIVVTSTASGKLVAHQARVRDVRVGEEPASFSGAGLMTQYQFRTVQRPTTRSAGAAPVPLAIGDHVTADRGTLQGTGAVGQRRRTPIVWSPLVRVTGDARIVGRDRTGLAIVEVTRTRAGGRWRATVGPQCELCLDALTGRAPWQLLAGRLLSLLSVAILIAVGGVAIRRRPLSTRPHRPRVGRTGVPVRHISV